jgi:hypothetical protein
MVLLKAYCGEQKTEYYLLLCFLSNNPNLPRGKGTARIKQPVLQQRRATDEFPKILFHFRRFISDGR